MRKKQRDAPITVKDLTKHLDKLKITSRQREFIRAAIRALLECELSERFNARVSI